MAPHASVQDGLLSLGSASGIAKWQTFFLLPFLVAAKQEHINGFTIRNEKGFRLILDKPMVLHADGEYLSLIHIYLDFRSFCIYEL